MADIKHAHLHPLLHEILGNEEIQTLDQCTRIVLALVLNSEVFTDILRQQGLTLLESESLGQSIYKVVRDGI